MKGKRLKKAHKLMRSTYERAFGLRTPYQFILDADFLETCLAQKMLFRDLLPLLLGGPVKLFTTACVLHQLRQSQSQAVFNAKRLEIRRCVHSGNHVSGAECIKSIIDTTNKHHYGVCAQQTNLRTNLRQVPGTPLVFINRGTLLLEAPSKTTLKHVDLLNKKNTTIDEKERKAIERIAFVPKEPIDEEQKLKKGELDPLSCKKSHKSTEEGKARKHG